VRPKAGSFAGRDCAQPGDSHFTGGGYCQARSRWDALIFFSFPGAWRVGRTWAG